MEESIIENTKLITNKPLEELIIEDTKIGTGQILQARDKIIIHYTGTYIDQDGEVVIFDSSVERKDPLRCRIGVGQLIRGWDVGLVGGKDYKFGPMSVGGKRKLIIPYMQAYGEEGRPPVIPAKTDLIFEVELIEIEE